MAPSRGHKTTLQFQVGRVSMTFHRKRLPYRTSLRATTEGQSWQLVLKCLTDLHFL